MNMKKSAKIAEKLFSCYNACVKVKPEGIITSPENERYIFKVRPKPGTKVKHIFECASDIKACSVVYLNLLSKRTNLFSSIT